MSVLIAASLAARAPRLAASQANLQLADGFHDWQQLSRRSSRSSTEKITALRWRGPLVKNGRNERNSLPA
jgi:hypothetical protein